MSTFGDFLKEKRKYVGLTQEEVAEKMKVSVTTVQNWEAGKHAPTREKISLLAEICDISKNALFEALTGEEEELKDNWPGFLFDKQTNEIINELHLNRNQQELFGVLNLYEDNFMETYDNTLNFMEDKIDLRKIPYLFVNQLGSINIINLAEGLKRVLYEVRPVYLLKCLKKDPETEFNIRKRSKKEICEFITEGCQIHHCEDDEGLQKPDKEDFYPRLDIRENLNDTIKNLESVEAAEGKLFWCRVSDKKSVPRWITYDNIPEGFNPELMSRIFGLRFADLGEAYVEKTRIYHIEGKFETLKIRTENTPDGVEVYIAITDKGRKLLDWYRS